MKCHEGASGEYFTLGMSGSLHTLFVEHGFRVINIVEKTLREVMTQYASLIYHERVEGLVISVPTLGETLKWKLTDPAELTDQRMAEVEEQYDALKDAYEDELNVLMAVLQRKGQLLGASGSDPLKDAYLSAKGKFPFPGDLKLVDEGNEQERMKQEHIAMIAEEIEGDADLDPRFKGRRKVADFVARRVSSGQ